MEERMHRFELYTRIGLTTSVIMGRSPTETYDATGTFGCYRYVWHVPADDADAFREVLHHPSHGIIAQHNQHFNMPRLTVFESIGWGFSQP